MKLPSGMTTEQLREHIEGEIAKGVAESSVALHPLDILALLVAMDLRERLDKDVELCARSAKGWAATGALIAPAPAAKSSWLELAAAAERVLKHEPKPDMAKAPS